MVVLETDRLILRHLELTDTGAMFVVLGSPEVMKFSNGALTPAQVEGWLLDYQSKYQTWGFGPWAVTTKKQGTVIGYCGLFQFPDICGRPEVEVGYRLAREQWGSGYGSEAVAGVLKYAFQNLGLTRIVAMIDPGNLPSLNVAKKVGMNYEREVMLDGYTYPDHLYVKELRDG